MKTKHLEQRMNQVLLLSQSSSCIRRKFGCIIVDPVTNRIIADGWNGAPRGDFHLCAGNYCSRDALALQSGDNPQIGCHHAEANAICNAASMGVSTKGAWVIVNGEPCLMCAKLIHHASIESVVIVRGGYLGAQLTQDAGVSYLKENGVNIVFERVGCDERGDKC
jgi:dCMP deaminase